MSICTNYIIESSFYRLALKSMYKLCIREWTNIVDFSCLYLHSHWRNLQCTFNSSNQWASSQNFKALESNSNRDDHKKGSNFVQKRAGSKNGTPRQRKRTWCDNLFRSVIYNIFAQLDNNQSIEREPSSQWLTNLSDKKLHRKLMRKNQGTRESLSRISGATWCQRSTATILSRKLIWN